MFKDSIIRTLHATAKLTCLIVVATVSTGRTAAAAGCISDAPPNGQPAIGQTVPPEFCVAGAAGQHYYLWTIPDSFAGRQFTVKLQSLSGETSILMVQSLDADPRKGPFHLTTLWQGKTTIANSNLETPSLMLKPGLYGIAAATAEPPGLFRLNAAVDTTLTSSPPSSPTPTPPIPGAAPQIAARACFTRLAAGTRPRVGSNCGRNCGSLDHRCRGRQHPLDRDTADDGRIGTAVGPHGTRRERHYVGFRRRR